MQYIVDDNSGNWKERVNEERHAVDFCGTFGKEGQKNDRKEGKDREEQINKSHSRNFGTVPMSLFVDGVCVSPKRISNAENKRENTHNTEHRQNEPCNTAVCVKTCDQICHKADNGDLASAGSNRVG